MHNPVKVLLVGMGGYGGAYVNMLLAGNEATDNETPDFEWVAGVEPCPDRCLRLSEVQVAGIPLYADLSAALSEQQAELIIISTPIHTHVTLAVQALESGASVLLEKPLCGTLQEAEKLKQAEAMAPGFVAVGYQFAYANAIDTFIKDIQSGMMGTLQQMKTLALRPRGHAYYQRSAWAGAITAADGSAVYDSPVMNASAHDLYLQLLIAAACSPDEAQVIDAYLARAKPIENFDTAAFSYTCGALTGLFFASHSVSGEEQTQTHFSFSQAEAQHTHADGLCVRFHNGQEKRYVNTSSERSKFDCSLRALRGAALPPCRIEDARRHIAVIEQLQRCTVVNIAEADREDDGDLIWVPGLAERMTLAFEQADVSLLLQVPHA